MYLKIKVFFRIINLFFTNYTDNSKLFINFVSKYFSKINKSDKYILVDYFQSYEAMISRSYFLNTFCKKNNCTPLIFSDKKEILFNSEWRKIYRSLGQLQFNYIFLNFYFWTTKLNLFKWYKNYKYVNRFLKKINNKYELKKFEYQGIKIGGDIIDEYLYIYKHHTIDLKDKNLKKIIFDFINTIDFWII